MDIFDSAVRTRGDLAGVFEYEEMAEPQNASAYFYLYRKEAETVGSVLGAIHIRSGPWPITEADIAVKWNDNEQRVGLFVFGALVAVFDVATGAQYGGQYGKDFHPEIPWS